MTLREQLIEFKAKHHYLPWKVQLVLDNSRDADGLRDVIQQTVFLLDENNRSNMINEQDERFYEEFKHLIQ